MPQDESPKIQVDTDWKAQAQAEKDRFAEQEKEKEALRDTSGDGHKLPDADFRTLVGTIASQAIMGLGAMADPKSGRVIIDLDGAKFSIDLLAVLEEKTKGNLSEEEATELNQVLVELRNRFVQVTELVARQAQAPGGEIPAPTPGSPGSSGSPASKIIQP